MDHSHTNDGSRPGTLVRLILALLGSGVNSNVGRMTGELAARL
jgi:hypothetical protein